jgi:hypothetical protein
MREETDMAERTCTAMADAEGREPDGREAGA